MLDKFLLRVMSFLIFALKCEVMKLEETRKYYRYAANNAMKHRYLLITFAFVNKHATS